MLLRQTALPDEVTGALFLHSMPGRCEPLAETYAALRAHGITHVICLAPMEGVEAKSPRYAEDLKRGAVPCPVQACPICDYGVPADREAFLQVVRDAAVDVRAGARVLVHCGAGVGRTGMFATCVLMALGKAREDAEAQVVAAGSKSETCRQHDLLRWAARALGVE